MSAPARSILTSKDVGRPEHYWLLTSPDGVLSFCIRQSSGLLSDVRIDGVSYTSWGIDAHIPLERCINPEHRGDGYQHCGADSCGLLPGQPCCLTSTPGESGHDLLHRWHAAGQDDDVIWAELERRFPEMVTANVGGDREQKLLDMVADVGVFNARGHLEVVFKDYLAAALTPATGSDTHARYVEASDALALAARSFVDAVDALPRDQQPAGWARSSCDCCEAWMPPPPPDKEPRVRCCAACVARFEAEIPHFNEPPF